MMMMSFLDTPPPPSSGGGGAGGGGPDTVSVRTGSPPRKPVQHTPSVMTCASVPRVFRALGVLWVYLASEWSLLFAGNFGAQNGMNFNILSNQYIEQIRQV